MRVVAHVWNLPKNAQKYNKCNSSFFRSKTPYKKQDEGQKLFMEDLVLFTTKGYISP
jgi:hypothetical protein